MCILIWVFAGRSSSMMTHKLAGHEKRIDIKFAESIAGNWCECPARGQQFADGAMQRAALHHRHEKKTN